MNLRAIASLTSLASLASIAALLSPAFAQPGGPGGPGGGGGFGGAEQKLVEKYDTNKDGWLNSQERKAAREFLKKNPPAGRGPGGGGPGGRFAPPSFAEPLLGAMDGDKDAHLSIKELEAGISKFFAAADADKKGLLDEAAFAAALNAIIPLPPGVTPPGGPGGQGGPGPGGRGGRGFGPGTFLAPAIAERADTSKDDKLTLDELLVAANAAFKDGDKDKNDKLSTEEINASITSLMPARGSGGGGPGGPGGPGGREARDPAKPGPRVAPADVQSFPSATLYEPTVLRTIFIDFENTADWEAELAEFKNTDVEIGATVTVDGRVYPNVGLSFRGASSFGMVPAGYKRSLNLSMDLVDSKHRLYGYKSLNLLNGNGDASMLSTVLYSHIARQHIPAPKANLVKVVINGESWGIFANVQQFNKEFLTDNYKPGKGARWKVPGRPNGDGGLEYLGDNIDEYKRRYEIKSNDDVDDWKALIELTRIISKTPADQLEATLKPILNIDGLLWFLALDVTLINSDGYWTRASDYNIYRDEKGVFHILPHDMNESFRGSEGGPGGRGGPGAGGGGRDEAGAAPRSPVGLDPLVALTDVRKPLRSKILAVPALREKYLRCVKTLAEDSLDWAKLGPVVAQYRTLVEKEMEIDTRKLATTDAFKRATDPAAVTGAPARGMSLRGFADARRAFLLEHAEIKKLSGTASK